MDSVIPDIYTVDPVDNPYVFNIHNKNKYDICLNAYHFIGFGFIVLIFILLIILIFSSPRKKAPHSLIESSLIINISNSSGIFNRKHKLLFHNITNQNSYLIINQFKQKNNYVYEKINDNICYVRYSFDSFIHPDNPNIIYDNVDLFVYCDFYYGKSSLILSNSSNKILSICFGSVKLSSKLIN